MKQTTQVILTLGLLYGGLLMAIGSEASHSGNTIALPAPDTTGTLTLEHTLLHRRSVRDFTGHPLSLMQLSQVLWATQGVTRPQEGKRTAPSAGALYPMELYAVVGAVEDIEPGVYKYMPESHALLMHHPGDARTELSRATGTQQWIAKTPVILALCGVYERVTTKYGDRGIRYTHIEVGCVAENVYLQAAALELGTVLMGAFRDAVVRQVLDLPERERPFGLMPVGYLQ